MDKRNKLFLYTAILIPIFMIVITTLSVYLYQVDFHPKYNFVYMIKNNGDAYQCWQKMKKDIFPAESNKQNKTNDADKTIDCSKVKFYEYDFASKQGKPVTLEQVKKMKLAPSTQNASPDGFVVNTYCYSSDMTGWGFYNKSYLSVCIKKDDTKQKLNIDYSNVYPNEYYYFYFISWILNPSSTTP